MEPPAATPTAGIYCKACGYDLRASGEAKRCPECGRAFAPGDPKSFRPRPFAAPWKRALGRWTKRGAILLLILTVLLAGCWGWFYWGWRQEQAAVAQLGAEAYATFPEGWRARVGRRAGPAGFVLSRVYWVVLPRSATDADLAHLHKLPRLQTLILTRTKVTDAGLVHLRELKELWTLSLSHTSVTGAGFVHLEKLPKLECLDLGQTRVTDAGLGQVAKLTRLRELTLQVTLITDVGVESLAKLHDLQVLDLSDTYATLWSVMRIRAALPACTIVGP